MRQESAAPPGATGEVRARDGSVPRWWVVGGAILEALRALPFAVPERWIASDVGHLLRARGEEPPTPEEMTRALDTLDACGSVKLRRATEHPREILYWIGDEEKPEAPGATFDLDREPLGRLVHERMTAEAPRARAWDAMSEGGRENCRRAGEAIRDRVLGPGRAQLRPIGPDAPAEVQALVEELDAEGIEAGVLAGGDLDPADVEAAAHRLRGVAIDMPEGDPTWRFLPEHERESWRRVARDVLPRLSAVTEMCLTVDDDGRFVHTANEHTVRVSAELSQEFARLVMERQGAGREASVVERLVDAARALVALRGQEEPADFYFEISDRYVEAGSRYLVLRALGPAGDAFAEKVDPGATRVQIRRLFDDPWKKGPLASRLDALEHALLRYVGGPATVRADVSPPLERSGEGSER